LSHTIVSTGHEKHARIVDVLKRAWHSRAMQKSRSARRWCLALLLSQALAIQALVIAWGGSQAAVPAADTFALICQGAQSDNKAGDTSPNPRHGFHHDCLSACAAAFSALQPQQQGLALIWRDSSPSADILRDSGARVAFGTQVFLARAPPKSA
jgi:hypothetical protein